MWKILAPAAAAALLGACQLTVAPAPTPGQPTSTPGAAATATPGASSSPAPGATPSPSPTPAASPTPAGVKVPFDKLAFDMPPQKEGEPLPVTDHRRLKTQADLDALLAAIKAPATGRPAVDWAVKEVLAFYDAGGNNGCYERALLDLRDTGATLVPTFQRPPKPGDDVVCTMQLILPHYDLYAIARTPKPVQGLDAK